jgi:2-oxoglutarate ferredoxin oxidoreductase subunit alpha
MVDESRAVLTGTHFMSGDLACAEGALAAGCQFFGGYPITPATEISERIGD